MQLTQDIKWYAKTLLLRSPNQIGRLNILTLYTQRICKHILGRSSKEDASLKYLASPFFTIKGKTSSFQVESLRTCRAQDLQDLVGEFTVNEGWISSPAIRLGVLETQQLNNRFTCTNTLWTQMGFQVVDNYVAVEHLAHLLHSLVIIELGFCTRELVIIAFGSCSIDCRVKPSFPIDLGNDMCALCVVTCLWMYRTKLKKMWTCLLRRSQPSELRV
jgi:hypothetical protein